MLKIAFVNEGIYEYATGSPNAVGGLERDQWLLARALAAHGWRPVVGVSGALDSGQQKIIDGVEYVGLQPRQNLLAWRQLLYSKQPDWLFWEGASHLLGPLVETAKLLGVRTIFHTAFDKDVYPRNALFHRRCWWPLYAWGLFRANRIFVQHSAQLSNLPSRCQSKAYVLPKLCVGVAEGMASKVKPHREREQYVAWIGMLRQPKRPDKLLEIARRSPAIRFIVCGGATSHRSPAGYGERMINDMRSLTNVEYRGQVSPEEAANVIANSAVLLSTSDEEGFPNTFTQAWASGTPIVSLDVDPDRIIERLRLGAVSGSIDKAVTDLNALINSACQRQLIADCALRYVSEAHSETAVMRVFERALLHQDSL